MLIKMLTELRRRMDEDKEIKKQKKVQIKAKVYNS